MAMSAPTDHLTWLLRGVLAAGIGINWALSFFILRSRHKLLKKEGEYVLTVFTLFEQNLHLKRENEKLMRAPRGATDAWDLPSFDFPPKD
jgi:hypothetical protein